jgi:predicted chitinase
MPAGFDQLSTITGPMALESLTPDQLKELQRGLFRLAFPIGKIDGDLGPRTRNAWAEFKTDFSPGNALLIGPESVALLIDRVGKLPSNQPFDATDKQATMQVIKQECMAQGIGLPAQVAYVLATTQWETAQTFRPVEEAFFVRDPDAFRRTLPYFPYYGRGFVQLTHKGNYETYGEILLRDLVNNPALALDPQTALFVLVHGFKVGTFTGRKIMDFISVQSTDFINARRCINGTDRATEIAGIAQQFLGTLQ